jgi:hypothetical protein
MALVKIQACKDVRLNYEDNRHCYLALLRTAAGMQPIMNNWHLAGDLSP